MIPTQCTSLISPGTSSNESLNHESNMWFRSLPELYSTTLELQLQMQQVAKLRAHNLAMYKPQLRQMSDITLTAASACKPVFSLETWSSWIKPMYLETGLPRRQAFPELASVRKQLQEFVKSGIQLRPRPAIAPLTKRLAMKKRLASVILQKKPAAVFPKQLKKKEKSGLQSH